MGPGGRAARVVTTVVLVALALVGSVWGQDDDFPFGPLRMYATTHRADAPIDDTWPWARDVAGREIRLDEANAGIRRAEIEGQLRTFQRRPERLAALAAAYEARHRGAPRISSIEIRTRRVEVRRGKPTGDESVVVRARWDR